MTLATEQVLSEAEIAALIRTRMEGEIAVEGATKRGALRAALLGAINAGEIPADTVLPREAALAQSLSLSLGTIQAALRQLQEMGAIERKRRAGTKVLKVELFGKDVWHFRLYDIETGAPVRMERQEVEIYETSETGPWSDHLGPAERYTVIRRRIIANGGMRLGAEMVVDGRLVSVEQVRPGDLRMSNIRQVLECLTGAKASHARHRVAYRLLDHRTSALFELPFDQPTLEVQARALLAGERPFYFQTLYVPAERLAVQL